MSRSNYQPETLSQTVQAWADVMPDGKTYAAKNINTTNLYKLLRGISVEMGRYENSLFQIASEFIPNFNNGFVDEWEAVVGIPDDCFEAKDNQGNEIYTINERLRNIIIKLAFMNLQTDADYFALAAILGLTITIESDALAVFPLTFPVDFGSPFTILITFQASSFNGFPFTFPITFAKDPIILFQCIVEKQKPAQTLVIFKNEIV